MAAIEKEFTLRAGKLKMDVNEKVKYRKFMQELKTNDRKATAWSALHVFSEIIFFWSILTAAAVLSRSYLIHHLPQNAYWYINGMVWFFEIFKGPTDIVMPYAFICMMVFGTYRSDAERARTKVIINLISLMTFVEQRDLISQMQEYVDSKVDSVKGYSSGKNYKSGY